MQDETSADGYGGQRFRRLVLLLLMAVYMIGWAHAAEPDHPSETGIRGTVLVGPVRPGPARMGQAEEVPLRAAFTVFGPDGRVAKFESDEDGRFELQLPPGDYTIVPNKDTPIRLPQRQTTAVTVPSDGYATLTIRLDTGMQ